MRRKFVVLTVIFVSWFSLVVLVWKPQEKLIWNRTHSAPVGLYWLSDGPYEIGDWGLVTENSTDAKWAQSHGYVGRDWPLLKRVSALPGDRICREKATILINSAPVANAKTIDKIGRDLPVWSGCVTLDADQVFLLNAHPDSLDGRYFGPTEKADLMGRAHKVDLF